MGDDSDLLIGLQLTHSGRFSFQRPIIAMHCPVLDPRTRDKAMGKTAAELPLIDDDCLRRLADAYVAAARLAYQSGFDFVDIKQCHRYLLGELLAAKTRPGPFGGSLENRARLVLDVVRRLRAEVPELIIATRFNAYDGVPYEAGPGKVGVPCSFIPPFRTAFGTNESDPLCEDLTEPLALVGMLRAAGVQLFNVSMGCPYYNPHVIRPAEYPPIDGYLPPENPLIGVGRHFRVTAAIQQAHADLPIVGSGYSYLQEYLYATGAANVAAGRVTFVGIGRGALAYPDAPRDVLATGIVNRKTVCRTFSYCTNLMRSKHHPLGQYPTGCPPFDKEVYQPIWKDAEEHKP
jgi:2,4-dienoyl-CoA reductase-like NADH-dependent reductase (Old Yellow Enzyme family)